LLHYYPKSSKGLCSDAVQLAAFVDGFYICNNKGGTLLSSGESCRPEQMARAETRPGSLKS